MAGIRRSVRAAANRIRYWNFPRLSGGMNLRESESSLKAGESPELENLWWEDGTLRARPGQEYAAAVPPAAGTGEDEETTDAADVELADAAAHTGGGTGEGSQGGDGGSVYSTAGPMGYAVTETPFHEAVFFHIGETLYVLPEGDELTDEAGRPVLRAIAEGIPRNGGTFFAFGDFLYYKNAGSFLRIRYQPTDGSFQVSSVAEEAFTPTILINADPATGAGDLYQPENRLSPKKRVLYNASTLPETLTRLGDGTRRAFSLSTLTEAEAAAGYETISDLARLQGIASVYADGNFVERALYRVSLLSGAVVFASPPPEGAVLTITLDMGNLTYHLPVSGVDAVEEVQVDGLPMEAGRDYTVDLTAGTVTFQEAPPVTDPPTNNTVAITYRKENAALSRAVMNCRRAAVYGSGVQLCAVLSGDADQPNAVYWSGHTESGLDGSYWPETHSLLVGDTEDAVTGFGRQYNDLIVFKNRSIGKLQSDVETVGGRETVSLSYRRVNDSFGCDCPESIRVVENNLVFCSTAAGICRVQDSSSAYENNIRRISRKVDGSIERPGLLHDLQVAGRGNVCAHDDGRRYYLAVNGHVWLWDYSLSSWQDPVWFYWTGFSPTAWFLRDGRTYHLNQEGQVTRLGGTLSDYGTGFRKAYQFPAQNFGSYDRLKDVLTVILTLETRQPTRTDLIYETDYESRRDLCPLAAPGQDRLEERDLTDRDLSVPRSAAVFRRKPRCLHVRHFSLRLENSGAGEDLAILTVQMQVRFLGKDR